MPAIFKQITKKRLPKNPQDVILTLIDTAESTRRQADKNSKSVCFLDQFFKEAKRHLI